MTPHQHGHRRRAWGVAVLAALAAVTVACGGGVDAQSARTAAAAATPGGSTGVFTTAHATIGQAARDFFGVRPTPHQPIAFPHRTHIEKGLSCTDYCHESAAKGPVAGLPSVKTCMICHAMIATDRPLIKQISTEYADKNIDIPWQRVYGYTPQAHVRFNHAPHIRAKVDCATCHGDIAHQTVAQRNVNLNMNFCVNCHRSKGASNDCLTCHY